MSECGSLLRRFERLKNSKKKRKTNYVLLLVSDSPVEKVKKYKFTRARVNFLKAVITLFFLVLIGYIGFSSYYNTIAISHFSAKEMEYTAKITELEETNTVLTEENEQLTEKVTILSKTVNEKVDAEKVQEEKNMPKGFPLSGTADMEETEETVETDNGEEIRPMLLFTAGDEVGVVSAGAGVVSFVDMDNEYGYQVHIDHGNGYVTIYRSGTKPKVSQGDEVARGALLYEMEEDEDNELADNMAYQVMKDGKYIVPTEVLEING